MRCRSVVVVLLLLFATAACSVVGASSRSPDPMPPFGATTTDRCAPVPAVETPHDHDLVTVDTNPAAVDAVWFPGMHTGRCVEPVTHVAGRTARRLALDVRRARPFAAGNYSCPADSGEAVQLYFRYTGRRRAQTVFVTLTGCTAITAPGRAGMGLVADRITSDLAPLTPAGVRVVGG